MMNHLAWYDFRIQGRGMALTRVALMATMLSSKKHQDGISKLVYKSDFDKLKSKETTRSLDEVLGTLWDQASKAQPDLGHMCWCTAAVRMVLHLLGKEKIAKQDVFESFEQIAQFFCDDLQAGPVTVQAQPVPSEPADTSSAPSVKNLLNASTKEVALFQNNHIKIGEKQLVCSMYFFNSGGIAMAWPNQCSFIFCCLSCPGMSTMTTRSKSSSSRASVTQRQCLSTSLCLLPLWL